MPDVPIEIRDGWLKERKIDFIDAIEDAIVAALGSSKDGKVSRLIEHTPENFSIPCWASGRFTHIEISLFKGRSLTTKRAACDLEIGYEIAV